MNDTSSPRVTIVIAVFNAEKTIERAVKSALNQTAPIEVTVVDDASTDGTWGVLQSIAASDARVSLHRQAVNSGPATARNRALEHARTDWVTPLDSDDFMAEHRIEKLLSVADCGEWDIIADDLFKVGDDALDVPKYRLWSQTNFGLKQIDLGTFVHGNISAKHEHRRELGFVKPLMRRSFLKKHHLLYDPEMRLGEDYDLYARALATRAQFCLVDPCGYYAVEREGSLSGAHNAAARRGIVYSDRRLLAMPGLSLGEKSAIRQHMRESHREWAWMRLIDAVKARNLSEMSRCFWAPPTIVASLIWRLGWQAYVRLGARLRFQSSLLSKGLSRP